MHERLGPGQVERMRLSDAAELGVQSQRLTAVFLAARVVNMQRFVDERVLLATHTDRAAHVHAPLLMEWLMARLALLVVVVARLVGGRRARRLGRREELLREQAVDVYGGQDVALELELVVSGRAVVGHGVEATVLGLSEPEAHFGGLAPHDLRKVARLGLKAHRVLVVIQKLLFVPLVGYSCAFLENHQEKRLQLTG